MRMLAQHVQSLRPEDRIIGATLAKQGALSAALEGLDSPMIYPFFMAQGWFSKRELPRRIRELGIEARHLEPFGVDPNLPSLIAGIVRETGSAEPVILVAHGSKVARRSRDSVHGMADHLRALTDMPDIHIALIEEPPYLRDVSRAVKTGICLPFFALRAGHVVDDIPEALKEAQYQGLLLPEIGAHPKVPALISAAIARN